jgi:4-hydroxy-4-methyl-2-oxoglutarate aldolase
VDGVNPVDSTDGRASSDGTGSGDGASDLAARLAALDACAVSDAMDSLGLSGVLPGLVPVWEGARLVGRAMPMQLREGPAPAGAPPVHLGARAIDRSGPGDVVVVANEGRTGMGAWGGLLSRAAARNRIAGVVIDGACRDVDEARDLRFPVHARGGVVATARGRVHEASVGEPVEINGVTIRAGDLVIADGSGVVVVSAGRADEVVRKAERIAAREALMIADLEAGQAAGEVLGTDYEAMLHDL